MRPPKVNKGAVLVIAAGTIFISMAVAAVHLEKESGFSISVPSVAVSVPSTISDSYSERSTALQSDPSMSEHSSSTDAATAAAYSLQDNARIWSWNAGKRWPIASLTKLMTILVASDLMPMGRRITITQTDEGYLAAATATPTFQAGDTLTVKDLITSMLIVSSDDAAEALADNYGRERFMQAMNDTANGLGMTETDYVSPSGLSAKNLSTTADLYKLVEFIWSTDPSLFQTTRETQATVTVYGTDSVGRIRYLTNIDRFAGRKDFLGGKTGTLPVSAQNLIALFDVNGPKAIIVLGSRNRYAEAEKILATL